MTTLKQQLAIGGQAISNLDKDMVITLDAHPSVQIDTIQEDSITYKFLGDITQDATYSLNLTFVYKKLHKLVMPVTLSHVVNDPNIQISWPNKSVKVWDEGSWDDIPFTVMFLGTDPAEDITASITNLVMVSNEYITITDNTKWRITNGNKTQAINSSVDFTFDVEHNETVYHCKGQVIFNIAKYDGVDYKVELVGVAEGTVNTPSKLYFKPTYQGRFSPGTKISPTSDANIRVTINSQEDDLEKELMVVTITGTTVNDAIYNRFIFYKDGITGNNSTNFIMWFYIKIWAKAITVTGAPTRTDTKYYQTYKFPITQIRLGHEIITPEDPRLTITGTGLSVRPILGFEADGIWMQNLYETVGEFTNTTTVIRSAGYAEWSLVTASYTTEVGENLTLVPIQTSSVLPSTHNDISILVRRIETEEEIPGLTLVGKPSIISNGPKALIKYYDDIAISDTPDVGTLTLSADVGHTGTGMKLSGVFKTPTGDILGLRDVQIDIPQSPMIGTSASVVDVSKVAPVPVQFTLKQLQFDNVLTDVTTATFSAMSATGEATAVGAITNKGNGLYEALVTPTAVTGSATINGTVTVNESGVNVNYPVSFDVQFNRVTDVVFTDQPLSVNVFQQGTEIPFSVMVEGVDITSQLVDVAITPTTNIITSGGTNWEIWTAPTAGVAEKITYTFKITGWDGELEEHTYVATFNIGPWDGKMLKVDKADTIIAGSTARERSFKVNVTYRGKAAADKVTLDPASVATWMTLGTQVASEDNQTLTINFTAKNANSTAVAIGTPTNLVGMKFVVTGKTPTNEGVDVVTKNDQKGYFTGNSLGIYGLGWCFTGIKGSVTFMRDTSSTGTISTVYAFVNGDRIDLNELIFKPKTGSSSPGSSTIAFEVVYADGTEIWAQILGNYYISDGYHNPWESITWSKDPTKAFTPTGTNANFWVYNQTSGLVRQDSTLDIATTVTAADDNEIHFTMQNGGVVLTAPSYFKVFKVTKTPANGNALLPDPAWEFKVNPDVPNEGILKFPAGHTGDSIRLDGRVLNASMGGWSSRINVTIPVPRAQTVFTPTQTDIPAVGGQHVDIEFSLDLKHYKQTPADLSAIVFKSISVAGAADINGSVSNVAGNKFKVPVTISPSFGTVAISGIFTEPGSTVEYSFSGNVTTVNNSTTHVVGISPFNVTMFERDTRLPFTVNDASGDITSTVKDVTITPNEYIITHGGADWEVWTGPTAGGTTKVMYHFTVVSNGVDELITYEATFTLPAWDGKMLKIGYNYSDTDKKTVLGAIGTSPVINTYTVYPIFRGQPAGDKVVYSTQTNSPSMTIVGGGAVESNAGYIINTNGPTGNATNHNQNSTIVYKLKPEFLNGQADNIEDKTQVTHAVRMRTYRAGGTSIYNLSNQTPYPKVGANSAFRAILEVRFDKDIIPTDDPGITYNVLAGNVSLFMSNYGVDQTSMYLFCTSISNNVAAFNNINATYNGSTSSAAQVYVEFNSSYAPLTWYNIVLVSGQTLDAAGNRQFKFTISEKGKSVVLLDKVVKGLKTVGGPAGSTPVVIEPKGYTATMDSTGVWTVNVGTGHTGDSFSVVGAVANATNPDVILSAPNPASPPTVTVKKAKGVAKLVGATQFEVKGTTKTDLVFTVEIPHYEGVVPLTGTFTTASISGGAQTTASNVVNVSGNTWKFSNTSILGNGGSTTLNGKFYETGKSGIVYDLEPFTFQTVDVSKLYIEDVPTVGTVMQSSQVVPFKCYVGNASGEVLTPTSIRITGNTYIYGNNSTAWRPEPTIPLEGGSYQVQFDFVVTIDGVAENHTYMATINVSPWDGVEYKATVAGSATINGLVGSQASLTVDQSFRGASVYQAGTWGSDAAYILAQSQGSVQWVGDYTSSPANRPVVSFKALKPGKLKFNAAVNYKSTNSTLWPVGTKDKNWQTYEIDVWIWDTDIRFASGTQPDPIAGNTGDNVTVPCDVVYANDSTVYASTSGFNITTSPAGLITVGAKSNKSWVATINAVNHGTDPVDVPVTIQYSYAVTGANPATYTMQYTQIFTVPGDGTNADTITFTSVKDISTRNWAKGILPFGVTINGFVGTIKDVKVTANDYINAIPTDALNNVWQCKKGGVDGPVNTQVEFVVTVNNGVRDYVVTKTINVAIDKDDGSEFWIAPVSYSTDYDGLVAIKNNNVNTLCNAQVYAYYRGDRVVTTATFTGLTGAGFGSQSSTLTNDNKWIYYFRHTTSNVRIDNLAIKLKYGTDADVVGKNTATLNIPVFYFVTFENSALLAIVSTPKTFTGKFGDTFLHNLNLANKGSPVNLAAADTYISYTAGGSVLDTPVAIDGRHLQYAFKQDVQDETQTTVTVRVQSGGTLAVNTSVTLTFIQQPLIPKLPLAVSQTTDIVGKLNDTGTVPMTITYGGDIVPSDDAKIEITADTGIQVTKSANGFDYKITLANTNPTGTYNANVTVTYEYAPGMKTSTTFVQPIKFTASARELVLTDKPISVKVWDIGTAAPFTVKAGTTDVTNLITDLKVTANTYVIQKASSVWQIVANAAISSIQVLTEFTYRLSDESLVRTGSGTFIIADYDGTEFAPYFDSVFSGAVDGYLMIPNALAASVASPQVVARVVGLYRGEIAAIAPNGTPVATGLEISVGNAVATSLQYLFKSNVAGGFGGNVARISVKRDGATNFEMGLGTNVVNVPYIIYDSSKASYTIGDMTKTLSGTYGDEFDVKCVVVNTAAIVDLTDPNVVIETTGGRVEVVPGSVTKKGFKLRFTGQITEDTTADQTVRIRNSATPSLDTTGKISITQIGVPQDTLTVEGLPEETTGGTGDTFILNPTITFNGNVVSATDSGLTISVTPDTGLEIVGITEAGIEVKVIDTQETATDFIAQLIVSKGTGQATTPWLHHYTVSTYEISVTKDTSILIPAENNLVLFTLKDNKGNPITDATKVSMDIVENPKYRFVLAGYSNTLTNNSATNPGQYRLSMNLGETAGTFTISLTVAVPGKTDSYVLEDMVFTNPGSPVVVNVDPDTIPAVESKETAVNVTLTRSQYLKPNAPAVGVLEVIRVAGAVMGATTDLDVGQDGNYSLRVISDGTEGEITIEANYTPVVNDVNWSPIPVTITLNAVKPVIDLDPMGTTNELTMNLWENKDFGFKVVSGDEDISSTVTEVTIPNSDIAGKFELIHDEQSGVYSFKAISSSSENDIVVYTVVTIKGVADGQSYSLEQALQLTTRINDGSIPVNRFNIDFV